MASELAQDSIVPPVHGGDAPSQPSDDALMVNGTHESTERNMPLDAPPNQEAFTENAALPSTKETSSTQIDAPVVADVEFADVEAAAVDPSELAPRENVTAGIAPVSDYVPKDAQNLSHPTPPPDPLPLTADAADGDTEMQDQPAEEPALLPESLADSKPAEPEQSFDSAPAVESATPAQDKAEESLLNGVTKSVEPTPDVDAKPAPPSIEPVAQESAPSSLVRSREEFEGDAEPAAKRAKLEEPQSPEAISTSIPQVPVVSQNPAPASETLQSTSVPPASRPAAESVASAPSAPATVTAPTTMPPPASTPAPAAAQYSTSPITVPQRAFLIERLKNNKKTKHAAFFLEPVDPIKLNIPAYPQIITQPMDLGTIDAKLKSDQYSSVQAFADDFNLMVNNASKFNGTGHVVTVAAQNMLAYFQKFMQTVPSADARTPAKASKKQSPVPKPAPRRDHRPIPPPPPRAPATMPDRTASADTFALQADGTPQIRRDSSTKRPARAIKAPTRDLTYAKPKRKEHQLELKFCEYVLDEVRGPRFGQLNHVFLMPVDPVALNIPQYRQIIKDPMDLSTMAQKLKQGQYSKAKEFKQDFDLMIENCLKFNPHGNPVRDLGIQFKREVERLWAQQGQWESANKPKSGRNSSAGDSDADESEEDDDDEEGVDANAATIAQLSQQLALMQNQLAAAMNQGKAPKTKKAKDGSKKKKQKSFSSAPVPKAAPARPAPKAKPKKQRPVTYEEKQEISSAVEQMNEGQIETLTQIITSNVEKYRNMGAEMELEIDDLPDDVQRLLLKHVRSIFGKKASARVSSPEDAAAMDDDDFEPSERAPRGGGAAAKRKKHKPMGKREQQDSINALKNQLAAYSAPISDSASPTSASYAQGGQGDTSGDDESEESEEE